MRVIYTYCSILFLLLLGCSLHAIGQEPGFMQFNAAPLSISPALAGSYSSDWRVMTQARSQWLGKGMTYNTQALTGDCKVKVIDDQQYFGLGGMIISDKAMEGIFKSTYFTLNGSYHFALNDNGSGLAAGIGLVGNKTRVDFSQLYFDQQLSSSGFDRTFSTGELALRNNTGYVSASAGLMYTYTSELMYVDFGVSGYRFIKMNRSLLGDKNQTIEPRYTAHSFFSGALNEQTSLMATGMHMMMGSQNVTYLGMGLSFLISGESFVQSKVLNIGTYYNTHGILAPCIGYQFNNYEIGLSYDLNVSPLKSGAITNKAIELNLTYNMFSSFFRTMGGRYHVPN